MVKYGVKLLIMDVDKTMHYSPELTMDARVHSSGIIQSMKGVAFEEAIRIYDCERMRAESSAEVLGRLGFENGNEVEITKILERQSAIARRKSLKYDPELVRLLENIRFNGINIFTIRNGTLPVTELTLRLLLGISETHQAPSSKEIDKPTLRRKDLLRGVGPIDVMIPTIEEGTLKPNELPFRTALELAKNIGIGPESMMMVGDKVTDIKPSQEMGIRTVQVDWQHERQVSNIGADCVIHTIYPLRGVVL